MCRLNVAVRFIYRIYPLGALFVTGKHKRVDDPIEIQDADFEVTVSWRH
jgi:hypothetical protein